MGVKKRIKRRRKSGQLPTRHARFEQPLRHLQPSHFVELWLIGLLASLPVKNELRRCLNQSQPASITTRPKLTPNTAVLHALQRRGGESQQQIFLGLWFDGLKSSQMNFVRMHAVTVGSRLQWHNCVRVSISQSRMGVSLCGQGEASSSQAFGGM